MNGQEMNRNEQKWTKIVKIDKIDNENEQNEQKMNKWTILLNEQTIYEQTWTGIIILWTIYGGTYEHYMNTYMNINEHKWTQMSLNEHKWTHKMNIMNTNEPAQMNTKKWTQMNTNEHKMN
jgi:hypothetical protein